MEETKMIYDQEDDTLFVSKKSKVRESVDVGDFSLDIDTKGFVSGIEILNASENLNISPDELKGLREASMSVSYKQDYAYVTLALKLKDKEKDITIPLSVDLGHGTRKTEFAVV